MKQWLDFWEKCKGKKGSPVLIGLLVGLLLLVITWPDNSSKKQNTQTKTNAPAVENNVRNTEDLAQERTQRMHRISKRTRFLKSRKTERKRRMSKKSQSRKWKV